MSILRFTLEDLFLFSASFLLIFLDFLFSASKTDRKNKARCFWVGAAIKWEEQRGAPGGLRVDSRRGWMNHIMGQKPPGSC
jgi:hypothetical protein